MMHDQVDNDIPLSPTDVRTLVQEDDGADFRALLDYLNRSRGFDFSGYKRSSLIRRIEKRMKVVGIAAYWDYIDYLEVHPDEFGQLFNMILINVTAFFRDPGAWDFIVQKVIPRLIASKSEDASIRVWSAGCASGEEPYTLAIVLAEALGFNAFRDRVKIYATDIDEEALAQARQATYSQRQIAGIPAPLLEKYFEKTANRYVFHKDLRRAVIFGRHDLLKDAPISRIDLLVCRNTLMYFNAEMQAQVLQRFYFALNEPACLFLAKAEMLFTHAHLFAPMELKRRVFTKVLRGEGRDRPLPMGAANGAGGVPAVNNHTRVREMSFDAGPVAQIVVGLDGSLTLANERSRILFRLGPRDIGRVVQDLELSYRPVELCSHIEQAYSERRTVDLKEVLWLPPGAIEPIFLDVQIVPLLDGFGNALGVTVTFTDVSRYKRLQQELEEVNQDLETACEELQTRNEDLQTGSSELNHVNAYLSSTLASLRDGVVVVDRDLHIQVWNHKAVDLWGLRPEEVQGKHLLNLDIGLPSEDLKALIRVCLSGSASLQEVVLEATSHRGRAIQCKIRCTPLLGQTGDILGAILLMEDV